MSCFETLRIPSSSAITPLIIQKDQYASAMSISTTISRTVELIGTGIGGFIVATLGMHVAILIDMFSFIFSALFIFIMHIEEVFTETIKQNTFWKQFKDGIHYALTNQFLFTLAIIGSLINVVNIPINALQAAFIDQFYHGTAFYLSLIGVSITVGSLIGGMIYPKFKSAISTKQIVFLLFFASGLYYLILIGIGSFHHPILIQILLALTNFTLGFLVGVANCHISVVFMINADQQYLSRVSGFLNSISVAFIPLISFGISGLTSLIDIGTLFFYNGIIILGLSTFAYFNKRMEILNDNHTVS